MKKSTAEIFIETKKELAANTDRFFASLMIFQWVLSVLIAIYVSPVSWSGDQQQIHFHVWAALIFGGLISIFAGYMARFYSSRTVTRHLIAVSQMMMSVLIIHVSNGRIESHFHIFGSLAFLSFYRDSRVLVTATIITGLHHFLSGLYWPESVYGISTVSQFRWLEHASWVIFEVFFLTLSARQSNFYIQGIAQRQSDLESVNDKIEAEIISRTEELEAHRHRTVMGEKMAALGEMASGMAHEINNPVAVIKIKAEQLQDVLSDEVPEIELCKKMAMEIQSTSERIATIIRSLKTFARDGENDPMIVTKINTIIDDTLVLCSEKLKNNKVLLKYKRFPESLSLSCRSGQISQILLNLLQNSLDAVENTDSPWIEISFHEYENSLELSVTDSGPGIPAHIRDKILQPFFTTKELGKGTGLGLSISKGIMDSHNGYLSLDTKCKNTRFTLTFKRQSYGKNAA